jgi:hypothetical protein
MNDTRPELTPEPNPITRKKHRHEVLWQITVPLVIGLVIILIIAVLVTTGTDFQVSKGADVSVIWLIAPMLVVSLILIAITVASVYAIVRVVQVLPIYARQVLDFFIKVGVEVRRAGDKAVEPFLRAQTFQASIRGFVRSLRRK